MDRRGFLKRAVPFSALPVMMSGFSMKAYGRSPLLDALIPAMDGSDRALVLIQLNGGNDGLNTVIPVDQYSALAAARSNIMIPESQVLLMSGVTGLHPAMAGMRALHDAGKLAVVQSVGYPNPNLSHFRATDIWLTASDSNQVLDTGWFGRYLDEEFPGYPLGYPNTTMPDPLGIQIGSLVTPGLQGPGEPMGIAITNPNATYTLPGGSDTPPNTPAGFELTYIREIMQQTQVYTTAVKTAYGKATNLSALYPAAGSDSLADQLRIVARLVAGGLRTKIYVVNLGGFDTHSAQVASSGSTAAGTHATLLARLSTAISAFQDDLRLLGLEDRVIGMTFSEFGRRIKSNASLGTDHGTAAPVFVFGTGVNPGIIGTNPALPASATVNDNIAMQYDFRWVYASVLQDWFGASPTVLRAVLFNNTQTVPLIRPSAVAGVEEGPPLPRDFALYQNYPNPFNPSTVIRYDLPRGVHVRLDVFNEAGELVSRLVDGGQSAGQHEVSFTANGLASGAYFYRLDAGTFVQTRKFLLIK